MACPDRLLKPEKKTWRNVRGAHMERKKTLVPNRTSRSSSTKLVVARKVFSKEESSSFLSLPDVDVFIPKVEVADVLKTLDDPKWWERDDKKNKTKVFDVSRQVRGVFFLFLPPFFMGG
jgi:hypothetical protein